MSEKTKQDMHAAIEHIKGQFQQKQYAEVVRLCNAFFGRQNANIQHLDREQILELLNCLGRAYRFQELISNANNVFMVMTRRFPDKHQGYEGLINIAQHKQDWQTTIELSKAFQQQFPNLWMSYWWLGQAYKTLQQYDNAQAQFEQLQDKFPDMHRGRDGLQALAKLRAGDQS